MSPGRTPAQILKNSVSRSSHIRWFNYAFCCTASWLLLLFYQVPCFHDRFKFDSMNRIKRILVNNQDERDKVTNRMPSIILLSIRICLTVDCYLRNLFWLIRSSCLTTINLKRWLLDRKLRFLFTENYWWRKFKILSHSSWMEQFFLIECQFLDSINV